MAKIACFGCSWTHGATFELGVSWVNELARLMPEHEFFNLSHAGSSVLHSIWIMEEFEKWQHPDLTIFQISNEGRKTYYLSDRLTDPSYLFGPDFLRSHNDIPNLKTLCLTPSVIQSINYGTLFRESGIWGDPYFQKRYDFAKVYYETFDRQKTFDLEHKILCDYIRSHAGLPFFHTLDSVPTTYNYDETLCIQHILGKEKFMSFSSDGEGYHFTEEGCRWQAEYMKKFVENKI